MKKILGFLFIITLTGLTSCGTKEDTGAQNPDPQVSVQEQEIEETQEENQELMEEDSMEDNLPEDGTMQEEENTATGEVMDAMNEDQDTDEGVVSDNMEDNLPEDDA